MVKLILTAQRDYDIEDFCNIVATVTGSGVEFSPHWNKDESGGNTQRYEIDASKITLEEANAFNRLCRLCPVEAHYENDLTGENYTSPASRFKEVGDEYHPRQIIDVLGGDIDDDALYGLYRDGINDIFTSIVNRHHARAALRA